MNQIFDIEYSGCDIHGRPISGTVVYPAYSCGHCSKTVVLRPNRVRPRLTCKKCGRWICETSELCLVECTPIYDIAKDHAGADPRWRLLPGILSGVTTVNEAIESGLLKE